MPIELIAPDASPEERERALAAVLEFFAANKIQPEGVALGAEAVTLYEVHRQGRGPKPTAEAYQAAIIMREAQKALTAFLGPRGNGAGLKIWIEPGSYWERFLAQSSVHQWVDPNDTPDKAN